MTLLVNPMEAILSNKKSILLVNYDMSVIGGAQTVTTFLADQLTEKYNVSVLSICGKDPALRLNKQVNFSSLGRVANTRLIKQMIACYRPMKRHLKISNPNLILLIGFYGASCTFLTIDSKKTRIVFADHGALSTLERSPKRRNLLRSISKKADMTVVLSPKIADKYAKEIGIDPQKLISIPNPISDEFIKKNPVYNFDSKKIITVGRLVSGKGYDLLSEVATEVFKSHSDWQWDIYGAGPEEQHLTELIDHKGLNEQLVLKGESRDLINIYQDYSIAVLTSKNEGFPLFLLEARFSGLPLVSFDIQTGPNELIDNNKNGFLIKPFDITEMAKKIDYLIDNAQIRSDFSLNSLKGLDKFKKASVMEQWLDLLKKLGI